MSFIVNWVSGARLGRTTRRSRWHLATLVVVVAVIGAACGTSGESDSPESSTTVASVNESSTTVASVNESSTTLADSSTKLQPPTDSSPSGEITIWDRQGDLFEVFDGVIARFNEKYPDITVRHEAVDIGAKLPTTLITATDVPDGVFLDDAKVAGFSQQLWDLSDVLAPYLGNIASQKIDVNSVEGGIYGVPWDLDPGLLFYNAAVLDEVGVEAASIVTYDDLLEAARSIKAAIPDAGPIHLEQSAWLGQLWLEMFASQQGTSMTDAEGNLRLDSPEYRQILEWLDTVRSEGLGTRAEYLGPTDLETLDNGTQVFVPWAIWFDFAPQQLLTESIGDWRAMPLPAWKDGGARSGAMGGSSFIIPKDAKNPELAWLFYEFLVFDEVGYSAVYGPNEIYPNGLNTSVPSYSLAADPAVPLFGPIEEMGGQDLWALAVNSGAEIPGGVPIPTWWDSAVEYLGNNLQRMLDGDMTPDEVISVSTEQIQTNLIDRQ